MLHKVGHSCLGLVAGEGVIRWVVRGCVGVLRLPRQVRRRWCGVEKISEVVGGLRQVGCWGLSWETVWQGGN